MAIDWTTMVKKYPGQWVALKDDEQTVVASGKSALETWEKARKKGTEKPILNRVPLKLTTYIGGIHQ